MIHDHQHMRRTGKDARHGGALLLFTGYHIAVGVDFDEIVRYQRHRSIEVMLVKSLEVALHDSARSSQRRGGRDWPLSRGEQCARGAERNEKNRSPAAPQRGGG